MSHINKPFGFNPMANPHQPKFGHHHKIGDLTPAKENKPVELVSLSEKSSIALKTVHQAIATKFTSIHGFENEITTPESKQTNVFDFEKVAKNVMSFINSSLSAAKSRGATTQELETMMGQARQGANQGIDEAIAELSDLNILDDELSEGIEQARDLINSGIDKTHEKLLSENEGLTTNSPRLVSHSVQYMSENYSSQSNTSDLSITTADGDIVTISFSALQEKSASENFAYHSNENSKEMSYQTNSTSHAQMNFSYSVQGDLDEDELQAIQSLIKDIGKIEKDFFAGNIDGAFNKALELGYDEQQLSSFNLELRQTQTNYVSKAYNQVANYINDDNEELNSIVRPVLDFIGDFKELRDNANKLLDNEGDQFNQLLETVMNAEFDNNKKLLDQFNQFIEKLS